ncbi:MAG: hypothetical protein H0W72_05675, partial [Planctomycetes bacterium]|nr:hypothetical protein [Planctomycetota bacterium]
LEDALLAIATPGASSSSGFAANRLRQGVAELARRIAVERSAIGDTRDRLLGVRGEAQRLEGALGRRLLGEADRWLKELPDLGLGADLAGQRAAAIACCERIVAASRTARPSRP